MLNNTDDFNEKIKKEQKEHPELRETIHRLSNNIQINKIPFIITNEQLYFHKNDGQQLLVIPQAVVPELLELDHAHEFSAIDYIDD